MKADTARFCCAFAFVAALATAPLLWFCGCREFAAYIALAILLILAAFIGIREQA